MAKQFDAPFSADELPGSLRPTRESVSGRQSPMFGTDDGHLAASRPVAGESALPFELFEGWDQKPEASNSSEDDPAVEMLEMGLQDAD